MCECECVCGWMSGCAVFQEIFSGGKMFRERERHRLEVKKICENWIN